MVKFTYADPTTENTIDKLVLTLIKAGINSKDYGIEISEKDIESSIKRLEESGKLG